MRNLQGNRAIHWSLVVIEGLLDVLLCLVLGAIGYGVIIFAYWVGIRSTNNYMVANAGALLASVGVVWGLVRLWVLKWPTILAKRSADNKESGNDRVAKDVGIKDSVVDR